MEGDEDDEEEDDDDEEDDDPNQEIELGSDDSDDGLGKECQQVSQRGTSLNRRPLCWRFFLRGW